MQLQNISLLLFFILCIVFSSMYIGYTYGKQQKNPTPHQCPVTMQFNAGDFNGSDIGEQINNAWKAVDLVSPLMKETTHFEIGVPNGVYDYKTPVRMN